MERPRSPRSARRPTRVTLMLALSLSACAQSARSPESFTRPAEEGRAAVEVLQSMGAFLAAQPRLAVTADTQYSAVQPDGQKLEFGGERRMAIRRPDRARIESRARDGVTRFVYFDRGKISAAVPSQRLYASTEGPQNLHEAMDFMMGELEIPMPLADLLHPEFATDVVARIDSGLIVGEEVLDGVRCDHLAFRAERVDFQIWIAHGAAPLPRRIVISYREDAGSPEFRAQFEQWNLVPSLPEEVFLFTPPPGATRVSFDTLLDRVPARPGGEE